MAKSRSTSGGSQAASSGVVVVSLRGDLSQLDADLKAAAKKVDQFAGRTGTGVSAAATSRDAASAADGAVVAAQRAATSQREVGFAAREAARDVREQVATIKDQLNDTTAFSGAGFADLLFGIDNDRIAVTRLGGSLADLMRQKARLDAELAANPGNKELQKQLDAVKAKAASTQAELGKIQSRWSGIGGAIRGAGATIATSIASSFLIGAGIGLATSALSFLVDTVSKAADKMVNPTKYAAQAFNDLAAAINKAGSADGLSKLLGLTGPLSELAKQTALAAANQERFAQLNLLVGAASQAGASGMTPQQALAAGNQQAFTDAVLSGINMIGNLPIGLTEEKATNIARLLGEEAFAAFRKDLESQKGTFGAGVFTGGLVDALKEASKIAFADMQRNIQEAERQAKQGRYETLLAQRAMMTGDASSPYVTAQQRAILNAQNAVNATQAKIDALAAQQREQALRDQLRSAAAGVRGAQVAMPGQTGFEVAAAVLEARARQREVQDQVAIQRKQMDLQQQLVNDQRTLANANQAMQLASIDQGIRELAAALDGAIVNMDGQAVARLQLPYIARGLDSAARYGTGYVAK